MTHFDGLWEKFCKSQKFQKNLNETCRMTCRRLWDPISLFLDLKNSNWTDLDSNFFQNLARVSGVEPRLSNRDPRQIHDLILKVHDYNQPYVKEIVDTNRKTSQTQDLLIFTLNAMKHLKYKDASMHNEENSESSLWYSLLEELECQGFIDHLESLQLSDDEGIYKTSVTLGNQ
jgi:hypothetical protein